MLVTESIATIRQTRWTDANRQLGFGAHHGIFTRRASCARACGQS